MFSFTLDDFAQLKFLEGRWRGVSADGKEFYEEYVRSEPTVFHSRRYPDASFEQHSDGSTIRLVEGEVVSEWVEFSWRAMEIGPDSARFAPVSAPSALTKGSVWNNCQSFSAPRRASVCSTTTLPCKRSTSPNE